MCRQYDAATALEWGLVNTVVPLDDLERETIAWCRQMLTLSPIALRMIKAGFNAADDGLAGVQQLAGDANVASLISRSSPSVRDRPSWTFPSLGTRREAPDVAGRVGAGTRRSGARATGVAQLA